MDPHATLSTVPAVFERLDDRFSDVQGDSRLDVIFDGCRWAEGPVYVAAGRYLVWSDIPNDRMLRWDETTGTVGTFRAPANYANGSTLDGQGRLVTCEQGTRRVTRTEHDGSITVLAERVQGKRFNSPNDVVVHSDGSVWFTDPTYGIDSDYEGFRADSEIDGCHVYRLEPSGEVRVVAEDYVRPNGLAFSPDETRLYIADTRRNHIRVHTLVDDGRSLSDGHVITTNDAGAFDGMRIDATGRIWAAAGDGVRCYDPDGTLLGRIRTPEPVANLEFGGAKRNRLFICATTSVYSLYVTVTGAARPFDCGRTWLARR